MEISCTLMMAGQVGVNKEGNLPDIPVFSILHNPYEEDEVIVGTELGVWKTDNFTSRKS